MRPLRDQRGNVSLLTVFAVLGLSALLALSVSLGCVYVRWAQLSHAVETARQATMSAGFQMKLKNEARPGDALAEKLIGELRRAGVDGATLMLFRESSDQTLGSNVRALALTVRVVTTFQPCTFMDAIEIPITTTLSIIPYAESCVYKPEKIVARTGSLHAYAYATGSELAGSGQMSPETADIQLLENTLRATVEKAKTM